ncbi:hypothetical protein IV102_02270 [bacterium]|nr:hypothetical protein [bacterium]
MFSLVRRGLGQLWGGGPASQPQVIWLRGESRRQGIDRRESSEEVQQALEVLHLDPFRVELGESHGALAALDLGAPIRRAWLERGYPLPGLVLTESFELNPDQIRLMIFGVEQDRLEISVLPPRERVQLELARAVAGSLKRVVNRDFVRALAETQGLPLPAEQLSRLSKYFRCRLQAGLALPPAHLWPGLSRSASFDEIGLQPEPAVLRPALTGERRKTLLLQSVPEDCLEIFLPHLSPSDRQPAMLFEQLQAIEELSAAAHETASVPGLNLACRPLAAVDPQSLGWRILKAFLLHDPLDHFQHCCRRQPQKMLRLILRLYDHPAPTLPIFQKMALAVQCLGPQGLSVRTFLENYLGPLPAVQATAEQVDIVLNDSVLI